MIDLLNLGAGMDHVQDVVDLTKAVVKVPKKYVNLIEGLKMKSFAIEERGNAVYIHKLKQI